MKKSIIAAGAASVALAAMPIVSTFAVGNNGTLTDTIGATVAETCSFVRQANKHTGTNWTPADETTSSTPDVMTPQTIEIATVTTLGTSNFNVVCNDHDGYQVTVNAANLALPSGQTQNHQWNYTTSAPASPTASYWNLESTGDGVDLANNIVSTKASSEDSKNFTITYKAYAIATQDAGTYTADVVYTFAQLPASTGGGA